MADTLFNLFGEHIQQTVRNVSRQPLSNVGNENIGKLLPGKSVNTPQGKPFKSNEPTKSKKTFLANTGQALQITPAREMFSPRVMNVGSVIYTDDDTSYNFEEFEFMKPPRRYESCELFEALPVIAPDASPPSTPSPMKQHYKLDDSYSYYDELFTDASDYTLSDVELELPALY